MENKVDLSKYDNSWYDTGGGFIKRTLWYFTCALFFSNHLNPVSSLKVWLLRLFGAKVGNGVVIKPSVLVKYPWNLTVGDNVWIGENVWIDNLVTTSIGSNSCISQGAMLLCGNHDYKSPTFDLMVKPIAIEDGCWIGAKSVVCPGVTVASHSVVMVSSVVSKDTEPYGIYNGSPAVLIRKRTIEK